jgi:hypothetical protein
VRKIYLDWMWQADLFLNGQSINYKKEEPCLSLKGTMFNLGTEVIYIFVWRK